MQAQDNNLCQLFFRYETGAKEAVQLSVEMEKKN